MTPKVISLFLLLSVAALAGDTTNSVQHFTAADFAPASAAQKRLITQSAFTVVSDAAASARSNQTSTGVEISPGEHSGYLPGAQKVVEESAASAIDATWALATNRVHKPEISTAQRIYNLEQEVVLLKWDLAILKSAFQMQQVLETNKPKSFSFEEAKGQ